MSAQVGISEGGVLAVAAHRLARGDRSRTWRWPGTKATDKLSDASPPGGQRFAAGRPHHRRRRLPTSHPGFGLGDPPPRGAGAGSVGGQRRPRRGPAPDVALLMAIAVLGVLDATAGLIAVACRGRRGASRRSDAFRRGPTLLAVGVLWFAAPSSPARAAPAPQLHDDDGRALGPPGRHRHRGLSARGRCSSSCRRCRSCRPGPARGQAGRRRRSHRARRAGSPHDRRDGRRSLVPGPAKARTAAPAAGLLEGTALTAKVLTLGLFLFVPASTSGSAGIYVGAVLFIIPQLLEFFEHRLPNSPKLYSALHMASSRSSCCSSSPAMWASWPATSSPTGWSWSVGKYFMLSLPGFALRHARPVRARGDRQRFMSSLRSAYC